MCLIPIDKVVVVVFV